MVLSWPGIMIQRKFCLARHLSEAFPKRYFSTIRIYFEVNLKTFCSSQCYKIRAHCWVQLDNLFEAFDTHVPEASVLLLGNH